MKHSKAFNQLRNKMSTKAQAAAQQNE